MLNKIVAAAVLVAASATTVSAQDWSVELYGGITLERVEVYYGDEYDMDQGYLLGVAAYNSAVLPGFVIGMDVMGTRALYTGYPGEYIESLSLMGVVRKEFPLGAGLQGYVSGGLGVIQNTYDDQGTDYSDVVPGAQIAIGGRMRVAAATSIFGEIKHQAGLRDADDSDGGVEQSFGATNVLLGLSFDF
jgi:hypothetical protein